MERVEGMTEEELEQEFSKAGSAMARRTLSQGIRAFASHLAPGSMWHKMHKDGIVRKSRRPH